MSVFQQLNDAMAAVSHRVLPSLVQVRSGQRGAGAGTIWQSDGLIITNAHVVQRGPVQVSLSDGREFPARVLARDSAYDLAALRIDATGLPTIEPGVSHDLHAGQVVLAFGHPWGVAGAATSGIVIGLGSDLPEFSGSGREWLAANLHLRPGHSGGPMVDMKGRLVGVNTLMTGLDVGMAVPVDVVKRFLHTLSEGSAQQLKVYV